MAEYIPLKKWEKFWRLTVLWPYERKIYGNKNRGKYYYKCICECWKVNRVASDKLKLWYTKSCWCSLTKPLSKWEKYWRLTILWEQKKWDKWWRYEKCKCECWNIVWKDRHSIKSGYVMSCWCAGRENIEKFKARNAKHWDATGGWCRFYKIYRGIKNRCELNSTHNSKYYIWKWVKCRRNSYIDFKNDMYESYIEHCKRYWEKETTIDRIDSSGDYCKENCRRATYEIQNNNLSSNRVVEWNWKKIWLSELYHKINPEVSIDTYRTRFYKLWWDINECLYKPIGW